MKTTTCPDCGNPMPCKCPQIPPRSRRLTTEFARWLERRGEGHFAYAVRNGMNRSRVALLAGVSREPREVTRWHMPSLTVISEETGISIARLIEDATKAAANPVPPRQYNRKTAAQSERADA